MKRRIIGMILVVVMLTLSLASCGYSLKNDDMSKYAAFSDEDKTAFLKALEKVVIENGDFETDPEIRKNKVIDFIYQNVMASAGESTEQKTEGVPGSHDKVYYFYYTTADFDGKTVTLEVSNMKTANSNLVLGVSDYDDEVKTAIAAGFSSLDFKDKVLKTVTSGKTTSGDIAYVSYTYSYKVTNDAGVETDKTEKVVNMPIVIGNAPAEGATADNMADYLAGKDINKTLDKVNFTDATLGAVAYSDIIVNWTTNTVGAAFTFTNVTYTEAKTFTDTNNQQRDVKDKLLTYHIFPAYFIETPEYNSTNLIDLYFGEKLTVESLYAIILGEEYTNLDEKEDKEKIEERAEIIKDLKTADGDGLEAFAKKLVELYGDIADADKARDTATSDVTKNTQTRDEAKTKLEEAQGKENPDAAEIENLTKLLETAEANLKKAEEASAKAQENYEAKKTEKDNYIKSFLEIEKDGEKFDALIERRYREETYKALQEDYNETIRMNLAKEVYYFLTEAVKLSGKLPEKAVDKTYESLIENYETDFYTGTYSDNVSNYKQYKSFENFLIAKVTADHKTVKTYAEAKAALREAAGKYVEPIVKIYLAAEVLDLKATDKEFKEYKNDPENEYDYNVYTYGENSVLYAYQLDKILDYYLEFEESEAVKDANGYEFIEYKFKKISAYEFGDPASEKTETESESGSESDDGHDH